MKILLVIDQFDDANNGTTISARRFAQELLSRGNEVRVLASGAAAPGKYALPRVVFLPVAQWIIRSQGMQFAWPVENTIRQALAWCDVAHFMMPFAMECRALTLAEEMDVPRTAAFHVQPENITSTLGLGRKKKVNDTFYDVMRDRFYNRFSHIHCPSAFIAGELRAHGYTAQLHVISNGVSDLFCYEKREKPAALRDRKLVLMIGRLSREKRQDVLLEAVRRSVFAQDIQVVLAGRGPCYRALRRQGSTLPNPPIFCFLEPQKLHELIAMCDLYVHTADAEIEAISCIEAFASGLVPVIANSDKSATPQFALDERSLFIAGDSTDLAAKMDYWLGRPAERAEMERRYAAHGRQYALSTCVARAEEMFAAAIREQRAAAAAGKPHAAEAPAPAAGAPGGENVPARENAAAGKNAPACENAPAETAPPAQSGGEPNG